MASVLYYNMYLYCNSYICKCEPSKSPLCLNFFSQLLFYFPAQLFSHQNALLILQGSKVSSKYIIGYLTGFKLNLQLIIHSLSFFIFQHLLSERLKYTLLIACFDTLLYCRKIVARIMNNKMENNLISRNFLKKCSVPFKLEHS